MRAKKTIEYESTRAVAQSLGFESKSGEDLETALGNNFGSVPQVLHVLTERVDGPLVVWIALDDANSDVRNRIYQKELDLMDRFPEIEFDFNLIPALGRRVEELATGVASRRKISE